MNRFYIGLGGVALIGGAALFYAARAPRAAGPAAGGPAPAAVAAAEGFSGYTQGSESAPVEIVEYVDFECPHCGEFAVVQLPAIRQELIATGKVRWRLRDYPLSFPWSRLSALAVQCAGEQGKYWQMADTVFFTQRRWSASGRDPSGHFRDLARGIALDRDKYDACMDGQRYAGRIEASRREGEARLVDGTPTFFVNGQRYRGQPTSDALKATVDSILSTSRK